jgi:hypothetical protein
MTQSSWEQTQQRSHYHFDVTRIDPRWDTVTHLGTIEPDWIDILPNALERARPVTWRTRGRSNDPLQRASEEYDQEELDLERYGMHKDYVVSALDYDIDPLFQRIADRFALGQCMARVHVQWPGQVWNLHIDKLEKWMPEDPSQVVRYFVQLTDWQPGHFWSYGNFIYQGWKAGDVTTFDWYNVPHATANAGHAPRVTLQITGIYTEHTRIFLQDLSRV